MESFQENYAKLYNFIITKKLKVSMTDILLPDSSIVIFHNYFKTFNKRYNDFDGRENIRKYFPKLLKKISLNSLNYLILPKKDVLNFKSFYNYFDNDTQKEEQQFIINTVIELLISSSVYYTMKNIRESITITYDLDTKDKEFLSMLLSKFDALTKRKSIEALRDLIKFFCGYVADNPAIIMRFEDDIKGIIKPYLKQYLGDHEFSKDEVITLLKEIPEELVSGIEDWLELFVKPEDFKTIPEIHLMIKRIIEYENYGLEIMLPNHVIKFLLSEKNINNVYILLFMAIESLTLIGATNKINLVNDILDIYSLPHLKPTANMNNAKDQWTIILDLFTSLKNSNNIKEDLMKYYNSVGKNHLDTMLKHINRKYNINYQRDYIEDLFKSILSEI